LARLAAGEMRTVIRIGQRDGVGIAHGGAAKQIVERGALNSFAVHRCRADDHDDFSAHQVSGR
jgi:hypothetical protein